MMTHEQKLQKRRASCLRRIGGVVAQLRSLRLEIYDLDLEQHKPNSASSTAMLTHDMESKLSAIDDKLRKQWHYRTRSLPIQE